MIYPTLCLVDSIVLWGSNHLAMSFRQYLDNHTPTHLIGYRQTAAGQRSVGHIVSMHYHSAGRFFALGDSRVASHAGHGAGAHHLRIPAGHLAKRGAHMGAFHRDRIIK